MSQSPPPGGNAGTPAPRRTASPTKRLAVLGAVATAFVAGTFVAQHDSGDALGALEAGHRDAGDHSDPRGFEVASIPDDTTSSEVW